MRLENPTKILRQQSVEPLFQVEPWPFLLLLPLNFSLKHMNASPLPPLHKSLQHALPVTMLLYP